jgi:hypothetical protein
MLATKFWVLSNFCNALAKSGFMQRLIFTNLEHAGFGSMVIPEVDALSVFPVRKIVPHAKIPVVTGMVSYGLEEIATAPPHSVA